ncbi:MAG: hypothetical protein NT159_19180 [Proteobacteria bacterium]|nr:hypothetical protein [Pseudomonadota bacterium]
MIHKLLMGCTAWLLSFAACAGTISFELALTGTTLTATSKGDSTAFYPAVFRMLADGRWERLAIIAGTQQPLAELLPGAHIDLIWPDLRSEQSLSPIERLRPLMVRFFDQAGVSFGQLSFMHTPPTANKLLQAAYADGQLTVSPPAGGSIHATWILWPQEEGIAPIRRPVSFDQQQPPARRIEWQAGMDPLRMATGAAQPMAMLVHETTQGLFKQTVARGVVQGRQQRSAWLDAQIPFYVLAFLAAVLAVVTPLVLARRGRARP